MAQTLYLNNPSLPTILPGWKGNPMVNQKFIDPETEFTGTLSRVLKWQLTRNAKRDEKKRDQWRAKVLTGNEFLNRTDDCLVWLGHASFFLQLNGVRILIDPIFGKISGLVPRLSALPCMPEDFERIDYVLLSHAHRDHCDYDSLVKLAEKNKFTMLTSLGIAKIINSWLPGIKCIEAGWYQQYVLPQKNLQITFLPTRHWSNRYPWDTNQTLWGSFMIESSVTNIYFGGDSGYCGYPKQAGGLFKNIDIAMIGTGAYYPEFMMKNVHTGPHDAVKIVGELNAKTLLPMHYGTFDLSDEPIGEPYRILKQLEKDNQIGARLLMPDVGQVITLPVK